MYCRHTNQSLLEEICPANGLRYGAMQHGTLQLVLDVGWLRIRAPVCLLRSFHKFIFHWKMDSDAPKTLKPAALVTSKWHNPFR
ncbi:unnamed protein product [Gongylonema pulchrum]|uniref:Uncharacterized protein n=1 Tax=Gongylonema pulchrum TaxID=637853 RepID=A0A183DQG2_9BILA|nr:unnamed protein product [Gongylonema pulchrum]